MSILSSLAMGHALHANGDATVTYSAVMATLTQVMRIGQALVFVGLFLLVVRAFWAFIKRATTLPCSHGFADSTECLDCSHPDWFNEVEASRLVSAPVVEPELYDWERDLLAMPQSELVFASTCEDYPCCGHTDGLGCDWVSPNEVQPCQVCIDARTNYPYHTAWDGDCPTARRLAEAESEVGVPVEAICEGCGEQATRKWGEDYACSSCWYDWKREADEYDRNYSEMYD